MKKPRQLRKGDTVAIVSPSWGGPSLFPHVYENGLRYLREALGLRVKEFRTARMDAQRLYEDPALRADDINAAFRDGDVKAIIASIGGNDSIRILRHLDLGTILRNPKILMGYSDTSTLLCYLNMKGLVTYYGNSVMAGFSYLENFPDAAREFERVLFSNGAYDLKSFSRWADSYASWSEEGQVGKLRLVSDSDREHRWIAKGERSIGRVWGGCLETLAMMNGTFAWPQKPFWKDRVLMIETSEDSPSPASVGYALRNFGMQGMFDRLAGLLVAKPKGYSLAEKLELDETVLRIVAGEFRRPDLNIVTNLDFGHTDPRHIMPLGIRLELDPARETLAFAEALFDGKAAKAGA